MFWSAWSFYIIIDIKNYFHHMNLAIYWTLDNFLKPLGTIYLPKSPTFWGNFYKGVKIYHFLEKSFFGNFYRHLAIFFWSHCTVVPILHAYTDKKLIIQYYCNKFILVSNKNAFKVPICLMRKVGKVTLVTATRQ